MNEAEVIDLSEVRENVLEYIQKNAKTKEININIKDVTQLSVQEIEQIQSNGYTIKYVRVWDDNEDPEYDKKGYEIPNKKPIYQIEEYKKIRKTIDYYTYDLLDSKLPIEEKFFIEIVRFALNTIYDCRETKYANVTVEDIEYKYRNYFKVANLEGGLINYKSTCAGNADIVKNMCSMIGVPCKIIFVDGHALNMVCLNEQWYYFDFTVSRRKMLEIIKDKDENIHTDLLLLFSDEQRKKIGEYYLSPTNRNLHECPETMQDCAKKLKKAAKWVEKDYKKKARIQARKLLMKKVKDFFKREKEQRYFPIGDTPKVKKVTVTGKPGIDWRKNHRVELLKHDEYTPRGNSNTQDKNNTR